MSALLLLFFNDGTVLPGWVGCVFSFFFFFLNKIRLSGFFFLVRSIVVECAFFCLSCFVLLV